MANLLVADTDVLIDFLHGREPVAEAVNTWLREDRLAVTAMSIYELAAGGITPGSSDGCHQILGNRVLAFDIDAAVVAGTIAAELRSTGRGIGTVDPMIAGACIAHGLPLATRNRAHFERIEGLELVDF